MTESWLASGPKAAERELKAAEIVIPDKRPRSTVDSPLPR